MEIMKAMNQGEWAEAMLGRYTRVTQCLSKHVGANTTSIFANCDGCTDELCSIFISVLNADYKNSWNVWDKYTALVEKNNALIEKNNSK